MCFFTRLKSRSTSAGEKITGWRRNAITIDSNFAHQVFFESYKAEAWQFCCLDTFINSHLTFLSALVQFLVCPVAPNAAQINIQIMRFLDLMKNLINFLLSIASFLSLLHSDHTLTVFFFTVCQQSFFLFSQPSLSTRLQWTLIDFCDCFRLYTSVICSKHVEYILCFVVLFNTKINVFLILPYFTF